jgi:hypothetical protein
MVPTAGDGKSAAHGFTHGQPCFEGVGAGVHAFRAVDKGAFCAKRAYRSHDANIVGLRVLVPT